MSIKVTLGITIPVDDKDVAQDILDEIIAAVNDFAYVGSVEVQS